MVDDQAKLAWCMFYSAVVGWQHHPGNKQRLTSRECADVADAMLENYLQREHNGWAGWQQRQ